MEWHIASTVVATAKTALFAVARLTVATLKRGPAGNPGFSAICHTTTMILVGVCGGIAAYKSCELVRLLVKDGHDVQVVQTPDSRRFVGPRPSQRSRGGPC